MSESINASQIVNKIIKPVGPFDYLIKTEVVTVVMIATFFTWRFLITFHDQVIVPVFDALIDDKNKKHVIKVEKKNIDVSVLVTEFLKWVFLITVIYFVHVYYVGLDNNSK